MKLQRKYVLFLTLFFSLVLFLSYTLAMKLHLFWSTRWIDAPNHFLAGTVLALLGFLIFGHSTRSISNKRKIFEIIVFTLLIGGLWEVYEEVSGLTSLSDQIYWVDTIADFFTDVAGALFGFFYFLK